MEDQVDAEMKKLEAEVRAFSKMDIEATNFKQAFQAMGDAFVAAGEEDQEVRASSSALCAAARDAHATT